MEICCLKCGKVMGELLQNGQYLAKRGGVCVSQDGCITQQCRHCDTEHGVRLTSDGLMITSRDGAKVYEE